MVVFYYNVSLFYNKEGFLKLYLLIRSKLRLLSYFSPANVLIYAE